MVNVTTATPLVPRSRAVPHIVGNGMKSRASSPEPGTSSPDGSRPSAEGSKTRSRKLSTLPILFFTCGLFCLAITLYGLAGLFGEQLSRGGHSASDKKLEMVVANSVLSVPENLIRFSTQRRAGAHQHLELYLHWPSLSGYQDKLRENFSSANNQASLIFLRIEPRSMSLDMSGRIGPIYSKFFNGVPSRGIAGLVRQPLTAEGGFIDEDLYYEAGSPYPFAARCVRVGSTIATPFCIRDIHIGPDLMLTYRFHVKHLPHWIKIDSEIRKYVQSLLVNQQTQG